MNMILFNALSLENYLPFSRNIFYFNINIYSIVKRNQHIFRILDIDILTCHFFALTMMFVLQC